MKTKKLINLIFFFCMTGIVLISGCSKGGGGSSKNVAVTWNANKDTTVNTVGGGYLVYYSDQQGFDISSANSVDVPYTSGASTPTSTTLNLSTGNWYIVVVAYGDSITGSKVYSPASSEYEIQVGN